MSTDRKWLIVCALSLVLLLMIFYIINHKIQYRGDPTQLTTSGAVKQFLKKEWPDIDKAIKIPTGFFIESIHFRDANNVHLSGYYWQKLTHSQIHDGLSGVIFPEAVNLRLNKAYQRKIDNNQIVIGWYFEGNFIQRFDYRRYPFDFKKVWVRMWSSQFDKNVVLTPDLTSYEATSIGDLLGIDNGIVLRNYVLLESFFDYDLENYDTNFGIPSYIGRTHFPELRFNIILERNALQAVMLHIVPLAMVLIIAFFTFLARDFQMNEVYINSQHVTAFLLFIIVVAHIDLRSHVFGQTITFLETLYFIAYLSLLYIVVLTSLALIKKPKNKFLIFLTKEESLIPKLIFAPMVLFLVLLATISML